MLKNQNSQEICAIEVQQEDLAGLPSEITPATSVLDLPGKALSSVKAAVTAKLYNITSPLILSYSISIFCTSKEFEAKLLAVISSVLSPERKICDAEIAALIDQIPDEYFANIIRGLVPHLSNNLLSQSKNILYTCVSAKLPFGGVFNGNMAACFLGSALSLQIGVIEKIAMATVGNYVSTSYFTDKVVEALNKEKLTPAMIQISRYVLESLKDSNAPNNTKSQTKRNTSSSVLDTTDDFIWCMEKDKIRKATNEDLIEEYKRALACKYHADQVGEQCRIQFSSIIKSIDPVRFDSAHNEIIKGLLIDVLLASLPRLLAKGIADKILTNNNTEISALDKIKNAEILAAKRGFELPAPSIELVVVHIRQLQLNTIQTSGLHDLKAIAMKHGCRILHDCTPSFVSKPMLAMYNQLPQPSLMQQATIADQPIERTVAEIAYDDAHPLHRACWF